MQDTMKTESTVPITDRQVHFRTPWFEIVSKRAGVGGVSETPAAEPYYSLRSSDYVTVMPVTEDGRVVIVRQYRPALEAFTIEFPSGHVDAGETPEQAVRRELREETGYDAADLELVGCVYPDTGRRENVLWCYRAHVVACRDDVTREHGVEAMTLSMEELFARIRSREFRHALDLAVLMCCTVRDAEPSVQPASTA